ncbi:MAG: ethanolamine ammonia-lyase [Planctomycetaceae bacterium]|nr:ethanolamine ammonia-lyase [Planctomycetaceae bacterium]
MHDLTPLDEIFVPEPRGDETYRISLLGHDYAFKGLKALLGAADFSKAGDRGAGLAAANEAQREAARTILSSLTLEHLFDRPLADDQGRVDSVMRVGYDIDYDRFRRTIASWTLGRLKNFLLEAPGSETARVGLDLTSVMAAAVCKLMDTHELIVAARKIRRVSKARTTLGLPGTLSARCQPNHPVDDLRGLTLLIYAGLSLGSGDALIGVNPAVDTVESISAMLTYIDRVRRATGAPTQICVLAHVKTQLACLEQGAPVEIMFQSLAGTEATNLTEFDISVDLLDHAWRTMAARGALAPSAENFMYFETGQGSEYTYGKHNGIDMATCEALCYGLARRYRPFMVNNVTGFIGPETHVDNFEMIISNLQDHLMGKLLGLPMGMAPCYTLHSSITLEGQQMATQLLAAAGANYYMDVYLNNDRMLAYFDTSAHDNQTLRELHGRTPAPEFLEWAMARGLYTRQADGEVIRGPNWGRPQIFCGSEAEFAELKRATPALYGFENAGSRPADDVSRRLKANQALARQAIAAELDLEQLQQTAPFVWLKTAAADKESHLNSPHNGARLVPESAALLVRDECDVQIVCSDGLSAVAVHANLADLYPVLDDGLASRGLKRGRPLAARYGRVKLAEEIAARTGAKLTILLIGERPGGDALAACSLSAYLCYQLHDRGAREAVADERGGGEIRFEYTVISNIYSGGLPPVEAGSVIAEKAWQILAHQAAGNRLEHLLKSGATPRAQSGSERPTAAIPR